MSQHGRTTARKTSTDGTRDSEDSDANECQRALKKLEEIVLGGLRHGYFECSVACDVHKGKLRLVIKAGVSHQFYITQEEVERSS